MKARGKPQPFMGGTKGSAVHPAFSATRLLIDIGFVRILLALLTPFRSFFAVQLLAGKTIYHLALALERVILRATGWLSGPPKSRHLRHLSNSLLDVRRWHLVAAVLVTYSALIVAFRAWRDSKDELVQQRRSLKRKMAASKSYFEWSIVATKLDQMDGSNEEARWRSETKLYDRRLLEEKVSHLKAVRNANSNVTERMFAVRADLLRNLGNIASAALHEHFPLVPGPIREYIDEVRGHLEDITYSLELPLAEKAAFLKETRHAFGRTALVLSGGGALGSFHLGVVKALLEHKLLPRVLAGSSVGAVVCSLAATRTDAELGALLDDLSTFDLHAFFSHTATPAATAGLLFGAASRQESDSLIKRLRHLLGDFTFLEAYTHTGRVFNLSVAAAGATEPPRLLNYLTAPHVVVWSAVACSSAFPGLPHPQQLLARSSNGELVRFAASEGAAAAAVAAAVAGTAPGTTTGTGWHDGSLEDDLPMRGLSEMFSVNHFIVSQTTPHIIPFLNLKRGMGVAGQLVEAEVKHRCRQALEILPRWRWPARWLRAFSQPWEGDITITLPDAVAQLFKSVTGPSRQDLLRAARQGELCTWAKLSAVQCNCGIEATLDACIQQVAAWERAEQRERKSMAAAVVGKGGGASGRSSSSAAGHYAEVPLALQQHYHQQGAKYIHVSSSAESLLSMSLSHAWSPVGASLPSAAIGATPSWKHSSSSALLSMEEEEQILRGEHHPISYLPSHGTAALVEYSDDDKAAAVGVPSDVVVGSASAKTSSPSLALASTQGKASPRGRAASTGRVSPLPVLAAAYECIDESANAFPMGSPQPRGGLVEERAEGAVGGRKSLDYIAP